MSDFPCCAHCKHTVQPPPHTWPCAHCQYIEHAQQLRRSNAAGPHPDKRTKATRSVQRRTAIEEATS